MPYTVDSYPNDSCAAPDGRMDATSNRDDHRLDVSFRTALEDKLHSLHIHNTVRRMMIDNMVCICLCGTVDRIYVCRKVDDYCIRWDRCDRYLCNILNYICVCRSFAEMCEGKKNYFLNRMHGLVNTHN